MREEPTPLIAVGLGQWAREQVLPELLRPERPAARVIVVTCLGGGAAEYQHVIEPYFDTLGLPAPPYAPDLPAALDLARSAVDDPVAIIGTPNTLHVPQAMACVAAGLDVFVERPLATPAEDAAELVAAADAAGTLVFTGTQRRLEPPFRYLHQVVTGRHEFAELASIRCTLAAGVRPDGWRIRRELAGGGIVVDTGYHLLDCAVWIAAGAGVRLNGPARGYAELSSDPWAPGTVETSAVGSLVGPSGVRLIFDLSYSAPDGGIFEKLECRDIDGGSVALTRAQLRRSAEPGLVTHQRGDGSVVSALVDDVATPLAGTRLPGGAEQGGPLASLLRARRDRRHASTHPCHAAASVPTWELTKEIYGHAQQRDGDFRAGTREAAGDPVRHAQRRSPDGLVR